MENYCIYLPKYVYFFNAKPEVKREVVLGNKNVLLIVCIATAFKPAVLIQQMVSSVTSMADKFQLS